MSQVLTFEEFMPSVRFRLALSALKRLEKAERRHGVGSYQHRRAARSRWLRG